MYFSYSSMSNCDIFFFRDLASWPSMPFNDVLIYTANQSRENPVEMRPKITLCGNASGSSIGAPRFRRLSFFIASSYIAEQNS